MVSLRRPWEKKVLRLTYSIRGHRYWSLAHHSLRRTTGSRWSYGLKWLRSRIVCLQKVKGVLLLLLSLGLLWLLHRLWLGVLLLHLSMLWLLHQLLMV
jgi:hypothetical protein